MVVCVRAVRRRHFELVNDRNVSETYSRVEFVDCFFFLDSVSVDVDCVHCRATSQCWTHYAAGSMKDRMVEFCLSREHLDGRRLKSVEWVKQRWHLQTMFFYSLKTIDVNDVGTKQRRVVCIKFIHRPYVHRIAMHQLPFWWRHIVCVSQKTGWEKAGSNCYDGFHKHYALNIMRATFR